MTSLAFASVFTKQAVPSSASCLPLPWACGSDRTFASAAEIHTEPFQSSFLKRPVSKKPFAGASQTPFSSFTATCQKYFMALLSGVPAYLTPTDFPHATSPESHTCFFPQRPSKIFRR